MLCYQYVNIYKVSSFVLVVEFMRYTSLDMARGFAIFAMLFFNTLNVISYGLPPYLEHGVNNMMPGDLIAPLFIFIVGAALVISSKKRMKRGEDITKHVLKRAILLIIIGMVLDFGITSFQELQWGVLQSIGVALVVAYLFVQCKVILRIVAVGIILAAFTILMMYSPLVHNAVLEGKQGGPLGAVPYSAVAILGTVFGTWFYDKKEKLMKGFAAGAALILFSIMLNFIIPFDSDSISASFVLFSAGFGFLVASGFYFIGEKKKKDIKLLSMFGRNALLLWVMQYFVLYYPLVLLGGCCFFPSWIGIGPALMMILVYYVIADLLDWKKIRMPFYS